MVTQDLLEFIRAQHDAGMTKETLLAMLVADGGWTAADVDEAYQTLFAPPAPEVPVLEPILPTFTPIEEPTAIATPEDTPQTLPDADVIPQSEITVEQSPVAQVAEPDEVIPYVIVPATQAIIEEQVVAEAAAATATPAVAEDDFLGIFGGTPEPITHVAATPAVTPPTPLEGRPVALVRPEVAQDITPVIGGMDIGATAASPVQTPPIETRPNTFSSILSGVAPATGGSAIKFNLSSIRKDTPSVAVAAPAEETKNEATQPITQTPKVFTPTVETVSPLVAPPVSTPVSPPPKAASTGKRTMASDLLLRGMGGASSMGMPALSTPDEAPVRTEADIKREEELAKKKEEEQANFAKVVKKNNIKRVLGLVIGVLALLAILGLAFFAFTKFQGPSAGSLFAAAEGQFYGLKTFSYKGDAKIDLVLSTATDGIERSGIVKFALTYAGSLLNDATGFGDGVHRVKLAGGLQSGNFAWPTDIESDIRVVGSTLYFRVLSFPETSNLDPELFKTYWIKVSLADVAKELSLSGLGSTEGYGNFGGSSNETTWNALMQKHAPFTIFEEKSVELPDGTKAQQVTVHANPDNIVGFATALYRKYLSKDLVLSTEQQLRLKNALSKIVGEVWISEASGMIVKTTWNAKFDDDMLDAHVKGTIHIDIALSEQNKDLVVASPTPILTLEELKVRMEDFKKITEAQARDQEKVDRIKSLESALAAYRKLKGRYPLALSDLYSSGMLSSSTVPNAKLKNYTFAVYTSADAVNKTGRCTTKSKTCTYYQLGVNLEYKDNPILADDADVVADIRGGDETGCTGELDFACFDVIPPDATPPAQVPASATGTPPKDAPP